MNYLTSAGAWGSNLLGEASNYAPSVATATSFASSGAEILKKGAKRAGQSMKTNIPMVAAKHTFDDPRGGTHNVTDVCHIAEGAFGAVNKVRDGGGDEYALKSIACQEGVQIASSLRDAEREATILKTLPKHKNIIQCYGSITDRHGPGSATVKLLLELCPGGTLMDYMDKRDGNLSAKEVIQPFAQICEGVGLLHSQKPPIQHRDLKVENVLLGNDGHWKLCDFGSCSTEVVPAQELSRKRFLELQEEIDKTVTMLYRPPEMADIDLNYRNGYVINTQVDIWMLGCILFTLTFYRHPFQDCPNASAISSGKYFIPDDHPLGKSLKLCGIIHWLLAKDPQDRPTTSRIAELLAEIGKCQYEDLQRQMPKAVQDKIKRLDALFAKRKDTGDIPLPPAAAALLAGRQASSASSPAKAAQQQRRSSGAATKASPQRPQATDADAFDIMASCQSSPPTRNPQSASNTPKPADADSFDLMSALASSTPSANNHVAVTRNTSTTAAPAPQQDLLGFGSPKPAAAAASPVGGGVPELGDLLGFGEPAPSRAPAPAASADWANFGNAPAVAPPAPASADWCADFGNFSASPAPAVSGGYNANVAPAATSNDLIGFDTFDFADPLAPSPAPAIPSSTAQSCNGAAGKAASPAPNNDALFNLLDM